MARGVDSDLPLIPGQLFRGVAAVVIPPIVIPPVPVVTVPGQMAAPTLTAGDGTISVARAAAPSDGGAAITSYDTQARTGTGAWTIIANSSNPLSLTGLTNASEYEVQTAAVNSQGRGAWSPSAKATPVAVAARLPLTARGVILDNSYGAQATNVDSYLYAMMEAGWRPMMSVGFNQSRGGDQLRHLNDAIEPALSVNGLRPFIMNIENDLGEVSNDAAGGDVAYTRLTTILDKIFARQPTARPRVFLNGDTQNYRNKPVAAERYRTLVKARTDIDAIEEGIYFDPQDPTQSSDQVHPNKLKSAKERGRRIGLIWKADYVTDGIFAAGPSLANNLATFSAANAFTVTTNSTGLAVAQSQDVLRDDPTTACRRFLVTGTSADNDPTAATSVLTGEVRLRISMPIAGNPATYGMVLASLMKMEITNAAGGDPVGIATLQVANGIGQSFSKQLTLAHGTDQWDKAWKGIMGILPAIVTGQTANITFDVTFRPKALTACDIDIRLADINHIDTEVAAYGPVKTLSSKFTIDATNRPAKRPVPTTTPVAGSAVAIGSTIGVVLPGVFVGGGLTGKRWDAIRDMTTDVGDMVPIGKSTAAVPYTTVTADGGHTIAPRANASNVWQGTTYTDIATGLEVTVNP